MRFSKYRSLLHMYSDTPKDEYTSFIQAMLNDRWDNSTQNSELIYKQEDIGSEIYNPVDISVDMAIDMGTGLKKSDDFKLFGSKNLSDKNVLGLMFIWKDNTWITINLRDYANPYNQIEVRRCNNVLKWIDKTNGKINSFPCCIEYDLSSPQQLKDKDVITANGHIVIIVQGNETTLNFEKNQRFIFNGQPFKLTAINNILQNDNVTEDTTLLYYDFYLDMIEPSDDIKNNIANRFEYNYSININSSISELLKGSTGQLAADVKLNGKNVDRNIVWSVEQGEAIISNDGTYQIKDNATGEIVFKVHLEGNEDIFDVIKINIVDEIQDSYTIVINPEFTELRQYETKEFNVSACNNNVKLDDEINIIYSESNFYSLNREGNNFTIKGLLPSDEPIKLSFSYNDIRKDMLITIKSFF